jgi:hypothetical protein
MITKDFHLTKDLRQIRGKSFVIMVMTQSARGDLRVAVACRAEFMGDLWADNAKCRNIGRRVRATAGGAWGWV